MTQLYRQITNRSLYWTFWRHWRGGYLRRSFYRFSPTPTRGSERQICWKWNNCNTVNQLSKSWFIKCTSSIFISISLLHDKNVSSVENQHHKGLVPCHRSVLDYLKIEVCLHLVYPIKIFIFFSVWDQSRVRSVQCMMGHI